jgi:hypothetical protein
MNEMMKKIALLAFSCLFCVPYVYCEILFQEQSNKTEGRNQQSLPIEKQKSLATYGPEDVFPTQTDGRKSQQRNKRPGTRPTSAARSTVKPPFVIVPSPTQTPQETTATVDPSPSPLPNASATPTVAVSNLTQEDTSQQPATRVSLQMLGLLIFLVSTALLFVIFKLMAKLREGSG